MHLVSKDVTISKSHNTIIPRKQVHGTIFHAIYTFLMTKKSLEKVAVCVFCFLFFKLHFQHLCGNFTNFATGFSITTCVFRHSCSTATSVQASGVQKLSGRPGPMVNVVRKTDKNYTFSLRRPVVWNRHMATLRRICHMAETDDTVAPPLLRESVCFVRFFKCVKPPPEE